jgi:hypothetical protein
MGETKTPAELIAMLTEKLESRAKILGMSCDEAYRWTQLENPSTKELLIRALSNGYYGYSHFEDSHKRYSEWIEQNPILRGNISPSKDNKDQVSTHGVQELMNPNNKWTKSIKSKLLILEEMYIQHREELVESIMKGWSNMRVTYLIHDSELPIAETSLQALDEAMESNIERQALLLQQEATACVYELTNTEIPYYHELSLKRLYGDQCRTLADLSPEDIELLEKNYAEGIDGVLKKKQLCKATGLSLSKLNEWY